MLKGRIQNVYAPLNRVEKGRVLSSSAISFFLTTFFLATFFTTTFSHSYHLLSKNILQKIPPGNFLNISNKFHIFFVDVIPTFCLKPNSTIFSLNFINYRYRYIFINSTLYIIFCTSTFTTIKVIYC